MIACLRWTPVGCKQSVTRAGLVVRARLSSSQRLARHIGTLWFGQCSRAIFLGRALPDSCATPYHKVQRCGIGLSACSRVVQRPSCSLSAEPGARADWLAAPLRVAFLASRSALR